MLRLGRLALRAVEACRPQGSCGDCGAVSEPTLPAGLSRETTIRRDAEGRWWHDGEPVVNEGVARAFDRWVDVAEDGRFCLRNEVNWAYVEIEGPPVFVRRVRARGEALELELSDGRTEALAEASLVADGEGQLACRVREGRLDAGFSRRAMLDVVDWLEEDGPGWRLRVGSRIVPIQS